MKKAICIDANFKYGNGGTIKEGVVYEVSGAGVHCGVPLYEVYGVTGQTKCYACGQLFETPHYRQSRFIPLSTIDELELLEYRQTELV